MACDQNPFSSLLQEQLSTDLSLKKDINEEQLNDLIENVFRFTIKKNKDRKSVQCVYMEEIAGQANEGSFDWDLLEQALFERLLLTNPRDYLIAGSSDCNDYAAETEVTTYLFKSFVECEKSRSQSESVSAACDRIRKLILRNASTSMNQPSLYDGQSLSDQWMSLLKDSSETEYKLQFLSGTAKEMYTDDELATMGNLKAVFYPMFNEIQKILTKSNLITLPRWIIPLLSYFVKDKTVPQLGEMLLDYSTPNPNTSGKAYSETLLGQLLTMSILPKNDSGPFDSFGNLAETSTNTDHLCSCLTKHQDNVFTLFKMLLILGPTVKNYTLIWIANCLHANIQRSQLWTMHNLSPMSNNTASDAFMFGVCSVLLRLCRPLCAPTYKIYMVDPTYCATPDDQCTAKDVHMKKGWEETCFLPVTENKNREIAEKYNFITELFYMTHKAIELSYRVCIEKFIRISREIQNMQTAYQDAVTQGNTSVAETVMRMLTSQTQQFFCFKNILLNQQNEKDLIRFYEATAKWLLHINIKSQEEYEEFIASKCFAPGNPKRDVTLPLPSFVPPYLNSVPENILENVIAYINFIRRFESIYGIFREGPPSFFQMILAFMGNEKRIKNPHLRAKLAEALESLLPKEGENTSISNLFVNHPDRLHVVPNLLEVFVSIEMTGQSVEFEQKFNYRRPMYAIMEFLWTLEEQKQCFKELAIEAEQNMEAVEPPLFLRFLNLLINDAIFLLDESLSNLQQIRQLQSSQDNGEWDALSANERQQNLTNLQHLGMLAKFDNILGRDTIKILKLISTEIKAIFSHNSMVDRIASMLNYFLLNLVGPNKSKFKVKDKNEFKFDPAYTVLEICRIYVNLSACDSFCLAVSQDGRSYSSVLFDYAEAVLIRIGGGQLIGELAEFSAKVKNLEKKHKEDQQALTNAPDEFLDPIMSNLMMNPVILPSSHVTVDRSTIARHLLSDQTDPFNRSPLTMDQVIPNTKLKEEIDRWIEKKRKEYDERQKEEES